MKWDVFSRTCPSRQLLDRIADKWTVLVICALEERPLRFGQLRRKVGGAAPKVLTSVLRALERDGVLMRRVYTQSPLRVEYSLTPLGRSLHHVVDRMGSWAHRNMTKVAGARARFDRTMLEKDGRAR
ncbi:MAG: winged helix-turn-helix transcriptional regulator [Gammaproteobacteria bacterium]